MTRDGSQLSDIIHWKPTKSLRSRDPDSCVSLEEERTKKGKANSPYTIDIDMSVLEREGWNVGLKQYRKIDDL
jgi:hypothetical protein